MRPVARNAIPIHGQPSVQISRENIVKFALPRAQRRAPEMTWERARRGCHRLSDTRRGAPRSRAAPALVEVHERRRGHPVHDDRGGDHREHAGQQLDRPRRSAMPWPADVHGVVHRANAADAEPGQQAPRRARRPVLASRPSHTDSGRITRNSNAASNSPARDQ